MGVTCLGATVSDSPFAMAPGGLAQSRCSKSTCRNNKSPFVLAEAEAQKQADLTCGTEHSLGLLRPSLPAEEASRVLHNAGTRTWGPCLLSQGLPYPSITTARGDGPEQPCPTAHSQDARSWTVHHPCEGGEWGPLEGASCP